MKKLILSIFVIASTQLNAQSISGNLDTGFEYPNASNQPIYDVDVQSNGKILICQSPNEKRILIHLIFDKTLS